MPFPVAFSELARESLFDGALARSAVRTDGALVVFNWLRPGFPELPPHEHDFDQLAFVCAGTLELQLDGTWHAVSAGEYLYIPAGVPHTARVRGDETVLNIDLFAPAREDYAHLTGLEDRDEAQ